MRKVRKPFWREDRAAFYVFWMVNGRQRSKNFPVSLLHTKGRALAIAEAFRLRKMHQINEDVFPEPVAIFWDDLVSEFLTYKVTVQNRAPDTIRIFKDCPSALSAR